MPLGKTGVYYPPTVVTMQIKRQNFAIGYVATFSRPAVGFVTQSPRLLDGIVDNLGADYSPASRDIRTRSGSSVEDWLIQIQLFNGLGKLSVTADGLNCSFDRLAGDKDLQVVVDVLERTRRALATHSPALAVASESVSGSVVYDVVGGNAERTSYFSAVRYPGRSPKHEDVSFKCRLRHLSQPATGLFEVAPKFGQESQLFLWFDVETTELAEPEISQRAQIANELVLHALSEFGLEQTGEASK
jgi:hypothetical protein